MLRKTFVALLILGMASPAWAAVEVVATLPSLAAIASVVGGVHVKVRALAAPNEDPHFVDARPSLMLALNKADLLIANGLELEDGWLSPLQIAARNAKIQAGGSGFIEAAQFIDALEVPMGRIDRSMGDLHPGGNPHFLNDPHCVAQIADGLGKTLAVLDPDNAVEFEDNATRFCTALEVFAKAQRERFAALPAAKRQVVTYHKSMAYLLAWLQLGEIGTLEPRPGVSPDPAHVATLLGLMRSKKAGVIVQEEYYPSNDSKTLARLAQAQLVVIRGGVRFAAQESYMTYLQAIADDLFAALSKNTK